MRKQYKFIKHNKLKTDNKQAKPPLAINDIFKRQRRIIVYRQHSKIRTLNQISQYFIKKHVQGGMGNPSPTELCGISKTAH